MTETMFVDILIKATVILVVAFACAAILRRASAATRHLAWALTLTGILLAPALTLLPGWQLPLAAPWQAPRSASALVVPATAPTALPDQDQASAKPDAAGAEVAVPIATSSPRQNDHDASPGTSAPAASRGATGLWILVAWSFGLFVAAALTAVALFRLHRLARTCNVVVEGTLHEAVVQLAAATGVRRPIRLLVSSERRVPMTWGVFRPNLLLPAEASSWSAERLRMVLLHELAHIARWDCATLLLGHLARSVYWFHPLAWLALAKLRQEQEKACDDFVLCQGASAPDYAEHLVAVTAHLPAVGLASSLALGMARTTRLRDRVTALLDSRRRRTPIGAARKLVLGALFLAVIASAASAQWAGPAPIPVEPIFFEVDEPQAPMTPETLRRLEEIRKKLREHYVGPVDDKALTEAAIRGLLQGLKDPYTDYLPAADLNAFEMQVKGGLVGIGAQLKLEGGRIAVVTPLDNSPALKAGLRPGDIIDAIDGQSTRDLDLAAAVKRIVGKEGTVVKLKLVRADGAAEELSITRGPIRIASVYGFDRTATGGWRHLLDGEHKIGYLRIIQFSAETAKETRTALQALQKEGLKGLILDLRFCPGGLLNQALDVCKMLAPEGELLTIKGVGKQVSEFKTDGKQKLGDFPVVVLVNDQTASAAELLAGVLQDRERAVILGTRTFGKGSVQSILKLDEGGALRVTTAHYYLPRGRMIHKRPGENTWGVDPNDGYYVPMTKAQIDALQKELAAHTLIGHAKGAAPMPPEKLTPKLLEERYSDPQLAAALQTLTAKLTDGAFLKVGQANPKYDAPAQLETLRQRREALLQDLQKLDFEIDAVKKKAAPKN